MLWACLGESGNEVVDARHLVFRDDDVQATELEACGESDALATASHRKDVRVKSVEWHLYAGYF